MTTHTPTTTPLLLPGQASAPGGPVDMDLLYVHHHGLRRDTACFAATAPLTPVEDRRTWRALARRWELLTWVWHHRQGSEDAVLWPVLDERATAAESSVLEALGAGQAEIDPLLASCTTGFARLAGHADVDARRALTIRLVAARERLGVHLAHREHEAVAVVQRVLTQSEWDEVDRFSRAHATARRRAQLAAWLSWQLPPEAYDRLATRGGHWPQRALEAVARPAFARRERTAFSALLPD